MQSDFTIIIPHRGNALGLWATIHSCEEDLSGTPYKYNYVIVTNGEPLGPDANSILFHLKKSGKLLEHLHSDDPISPPVARQRGAGIADGKLLFFFDNHCLVGRRYFERAALAMDSKGMDMLHSTTRFYQGDPAHYHYRLRLDFNFWAESSLLAYDSFRPYKIAAAGHGGFVARKDVWDEVGGYGPEELLVGYGGEELIFDLKMWRFGKNNYIDPKLIHYHYAGVRGYARHFTDDYYVNLMVSANVIGGEKWLYKVFDSFVTKRHVRYNPAKPMYDLLEEAYNRSAEYAAEVERRSVISLDALLEQFRTNQVCYT